jgi:hypothetical protein
MITLRASELGSCTKAQAAKLLDYTPLAPPERIQEAFDRGVAHEGENADALREQGYGITGEQQLITIPIDPDAQIEGHVDGIIYHSTEHPRSRVWESKSPGAWEKFQNAYLTDDWSDPLCHRYGYQISCYMYALSMEAMVTCLDGDELKSFVIEVPPFDLPELVAQAELILEQARGGVLLRDCSQTDWPCPFVYLHEDEEVDDDLDMDGLVAKRSIYVQARKRADDAVKELDKEIRAHLGDREQVVTAWSRVTRYEQANPAKWDQDAMKADGVWDKYRIPGAMGSRIRVTLRGQDEEKE